MLWAAVVGGALVPLNSTMIAVAIPDIVKSFDVPASAASVLVLTYLVVMAAGQPFAGRLGDRLGHRRVAATALAGFAVASAAAALAPSFVTLVIPRALQALFGAAIIPNLQALLQASAPADRRGRLFGYFGLGIGAGAAAGPLLAGGLVAAWGWPAIFAVNLPVVAAALLLLLRVHAPEIAIATAEERRGAGRLLHRPAFVAACIVQAGSNLGQYVVLLAVPLILDGHGWSSGGTGVVLTLLTISLLLLSPVGGRVGDRVGRRGPVSAGTTIAAAGLVLIAVVADTGATAGLVIGVAVVGVGMGFGMASLQAAGMESVPTALAGTAAGVLHTSRYAGSIVGTTFLSALVGDGGEGSRPVLLLALGAMLLAVAASRWLPRSAGAPAAVPADSLGG